MKVKAIAKFQDMKEGMLREVGDVFEVSEERYDEITKAGEFVEEVEDDEEGLESMTKAELIEKAKALGVSEEDIKAAKKKEDLITLIQMKEDGE